MNKNDEYEIFAQEVYQKLLDAEGVKNITVKHNVKLSGVSEQKHQIDVYWEYELAGVVHRVAIECKNYKNAISLGHVRNFHSVLRDLNNVSGIMVTTMGYQKGAKKYGKFYDIGLKTLVKPKRGDSIIGEIDINLDINIRHRLFNVDREWCKENRIDIEGYLKRTDSLYLNIREGSKRWINQQYIPLSTISDNIYTAQHEVITNIKKLESQISSEICTLSDETFDVDGFVETREWGFIKITQVQFKHEHEDKRRVINLDAADFVKAILKDTITNKTQYIPSF